MTDPPSVKPLLKRVLLGQVLFTWHTIKRKWLRATVVRCSLSPEVRLGAGARGRRTHTHSTEQQTHAGGTHSGVKGVLWRRHGLLSCGL